MPGSVSGTTVAAVAALWGMALLAVLLLRRRDPDRRERARLVREARRLGWRAARAGDGAVIRFLGGAEGTEWELDVGLAPTGSHRPVTRWRAAGTGLEGAAALIGPRPAKQPPGLDFSGVLAGFLVSRLLGPHVMPPAGLREVTAGSVSLRRRFAVLATGAEAAERLLTPAVEARLLCWHEPRCQPAVAFTAEGLIVQLAGIVLDLGMLERLVRLGEALRHAAEGSEAVER
jgi:hypothetical protein